MIEIPQKIVCVGLNYRDHAAEQGVDLLQRPLLFAKWPNTLIANGEPIRIRDVTTQVDYEAELGVVISRTAKDVALEEAFGFVQGYVVANDVSARDLQFADVQWVRGKSLDTFLPVSDLVPAIDVPDPQTLPIRAIRNGETLQDSNTRELVFKVPELIEYLSSITPLLPGDIISTGTPPGVGLGRNPKRWLRPGETVTVTVQGLGSLTNPVVAE